VHGFATYGPLARTVADAAAFLDVISGPEPGDPHAAPPPERPFVEEVGAPPGRLRVALVVDPPSRTRVDPACTSAARDAGALLEQLGHDVEEVSVEWGADFLDVFTTVWQTIPTLYVSDISQLEPFNAALAERALATSSAEYLRAYSLVQRYGRRVAAFCARYDIVLTPTLALPPVPIGWVREPADPWEQYGRAIEFAPFTAPVNIAGLPAVSVPFGSTGDGLPVGVQLVASANEEARLLRLSAQIEEAQPWARTLPTLPDT
jgi:amidase